MQKVKTTTHIVRKKVQEGKMINQYLKIKTIGEGCYSKVKLMKNVEDGKLYAMKKYNLCIMKKKKRMIGRQNGQKHGKPIYKSAAEQALEQIEVMSSLQHSNVVKLFEVLDDQQQEKLYLIMDYCSQGEIAKWNQKTEIFKASPEIQKFSILLDKVKQTVKGLCYCIIFLKKDIKPQNILIDSEGTVKIIDFGRAIQLKSKEQKLKGSEGTYQFMAPEMLSEIYPEGYDGSKCDIWSFGVSLFGILFGQLPFYEELLIKLFEQIQTAKYTIPKDFCKQYQPLIPLVQKMLSKKPQQRPSASEMMQKLSEIQIK